MNKSFWKGITFAFIVCAFIFILIVNFYFVNVRLTGLENFAQSVIKASQPQQPRPMPVEKPKE